MDEKHPYIEYCTFDTKIWKLYLDEAEAEDKELVKSWETGLDSLLIFVS